MLKKLYSVRKKKIKKISLFAHNIHKGLRSKTLHMYTNMYLILNTYTILTTLIKNKQVSTI